MGIVIIYATFIIILVTIFGRNTFLVFVTIGRSNWQCRRGQLDWGHLQPGDRHG